MEKIPTNRDIISTFNKNKALNKESVKSLSNNEVFERLLEIEQIEEMLKNIKNTLQKQAINKNMNIYNYNIEKKIYILKSSNTVFETEKIGKLCLKKGFMDEFIKISNVSKAKFDVLESDNLSAVKKIVDKHMSSIPKNPTVKITNISKKELKEYYANQRKLKKTS